MTVKKTRTRRGFSLIELVIVIIIIGVLGGIGANFGSRQVANARLNTAASNLQLIASDVESAVLDLGFLDNLDDPAATKRYFSTWDAKYLTSPLDTENISEKTAFGSDFNGVIVNTHGYADPWENEYRFYYIIPVTGENYRVLIASAGPNGMWAEDAENGYINCQDDATLFEDDIVMVMEPRG